jgi:hypothetical protein
MKEIYTEKEVEYMNNSTEFTLINVDILDYDYELVETVECLIESYIYNQLNENESFIDDEPVKVVVLNDCFKSGYKTGSVISVEFSPEKSNPFHVIE